jgi:glycosyltransferase involved in cell wall biosynthesis
MSNKKTRLAIIIPAFNEEKTIKQVIKNIPNIPNIQQRIIVIDDGSVDNTLTYAKTQRVDIISNKRHIGLGSVFKLGISYSLENKCNFIAILDADGQYESKMLKNLIYLIYNENYDLVIGNRFINGGYFESGILKRLCNLLISIFISKVLLRLDITYDVQSSFRVFNDRLARLIIKKIEAKHNYAQEMFILANLYKFKIKQIPVKCKKRISGKSRLIKNPVLHLVRVIWICIKTYVKNVNLK